MPTQQGWLYLTIVMDLCDRKIIGWALSESMKAIDTSIPAWKMAVKNRSVEPNLIFHSDRGIQYACHSFTQELKPTPCYCKVGVGKVIVGIMPWQKAFFGVVT